MKPGFIAPDAERRRESRSQSGDVIPGVGRRCLTENPADGLVPERAVRQVGVSLSPDAARHADDLQRALTFRGHRPSLVAGSRVAAGVGRSILERDSADAAAADDSAVVGEAEVDIGHGFVDLHWLLQPGYTVRRRRMFVHRPEARVIVT
jgi:hypothetical protein